MGGLQQWINKLHVWHSNETVQFEQLNDIVLQNGQFHISVERDAIYSLTTTTGQRKGEYTVPPVNTPFPFPYRDDFNSYPLDGYAKYFSDEAGTFEIRQDPLNAKNFALYQAAPANPGGNAWIPNANPFTAIGNNSWVNQVVDVEILFDKGANGGDYISVCGRVNIGQWNPFSSPPEDLPGYCLRVFRNGQWELRQPKVLSNGKIPNFNEGVWHTVELAINENVVIIKLDGVTYDTVKDNSRSSGYAVLGSGWNTAYYDNFYVH